MSVKRRYHVGIASVPVSGFCPGKGAFGGQGQERVRRRGDPGRSPIFCLPAGWTKTGAADGGFSERFAMSIWQR
ncbi:hypothetical protein SAMN04490248_11720 [Salinihabitans flavidus]|uniref:Uncharacterized protein n=1 Tax=Salinihabitans flavidus TaxID=569882 RepID=A0A1H8TW20_9RHOB|nr:hypothetical protein SAMN04490248_11720 [Salinihabitans flavidus]